MTFLHTKHSLEFWYIEQKINTTKLPLLAINQIFFWWKLSIILCNLWGTLVCVRVVSEFFWKINFACQSRLVVCSCLLMSEMDCTTVADPKGVWGVTWTASLPVPHLPPPLVLNFLWKWNNLVSNCFIFIGYLGKNEINQQREPPHLYTCTYEPLSRNPGSAPALHGYFATLTLKLTVIQIGADQTFWCTGCFVILWLK